MNGIIVLPMISVLIGLYLITLGLWELRVGMNRSRFITFMFSGLFFAFIVSGIIVLGVADFIL